MANKNSNLKVVVAIEEGDNHFVVVILIKIARDKSDRRGHIQRHREPGGIRCTPFICKLLHIPSANGGTQYCLEQHIHASSRVCIHGKHILSYCRGEMTIDTSGK